MRYYITKHTMVHKGEKLLYPEEGFAGRLSEALEMAQAWVLSGVNRSAFVNKGKGGPALYHYWADKEGMQYIKYA